MSDEPAGAVYRIEDLAHRSGATVRTIRAYQDRGLLPRPERRGRANVYGDAHLVRLRQIADLLDRGYTLASIKELLEAWDTGRGLGGILGLVAEVDGPWTDERAVRISRAELAERFGGVRTTRRSRTPSNWVCWSPFPAARTRSSSRVPKNWPWQPSCTRRAFRCPRSPAICGS